LASSTTQLGHAAATPQLDQYPEADIQYRI